MLIVNDEQRLRAGIGSLSKRCQYCSKALAAYPLILSDDARLAVYKAALRDQAFSGGTQVRCPIGRVVAKRRAEMTAPGHDLWLGALVQRGECEH